MTHFVADNLEYKIKAASPKDGKSLLFYTLLLSIEPFPWLTIGAVANTSKYASRNTMLPVETATEQIQRQFFSAFPQIDSNALNDIEIEAQYLAANLDGITENLGNLLHSVSKKSKENSERWKRAKKNWHNCCQIVNTVTHIDDIFSVDFFNHCR